MCVCVLREVQGLARKEWFWLATVSVERFFYFARKNRDFVLKCRKMEKVLRLGFLVWNAEDRRCNPKEIA